MTIKPEAQAERENFRDRLAKRGAAVQVARDAVVNKARRMVAMDDDEAFAALDAAVAELDRQEARLKEVGE